jgi:NAD-dependent deacetylase
VIARWTRERSHTTLITQNVDGLHERAGALNVIRLHGSIWSLRCSAGCRAGASGWTDETVPLSPLPPTCPHCGGLARPGVVWFGESLDPDVVRQADVACRCDLFLTIGSSSVVYPAAGLVHAARRRGAFTAEINLDTTDVSAAVDLAIHGRAEEVLKQLADAMADRSRS